ncbi:tryptophan 7-halogenase [Paraglaciecola sp.]|uniref:tryptophan 7-halogenase n=1 Tax=Paraglaciecola sp. TaxID=1920173 RepID=UPI003EF5A696
MKACPIKKVLVVGKDLDAWITALFLKTSLRMTDEKITIELIELPSQLTEHDFYSVLPSYKTIHQALGANEKRLLELSQAHHFFAQRFSAWNNHKPDYFQSYGKLGANFNSVDFYQYWIKAVQQGLNVPLEDFSFGASAAKHTNLEISNIPKDAPPFGYHLSALPYLQTIKEAALAAGINPIQSDIKQVKLDKKRISEIELTNGQILSADLFIDASGKQNSLLKHLKSDNFESWSDTFLCDRMITTSVSGFSPKPAYSLISAFSAGWFGLYPLQNRTGLYIYYSSAHSDKEQVLKEVSEISNIKMDNLKDSPIETGITKQPWVGNCVAIGEAAATFEALDALKLNPLVTSLVQLRELFPVHCDFELEAATYNRKLHQFLNPVKDVQTAHYKLNSREGQPFWDACRNMPVSANLSEKIALFARLGHVSVREYDSFLEESWTLLFNGHGLKPKGSHPLVDRVSDDELKQQFMSLLQNVAQQTKGLSAGR